MATSSSSPNETLIQKIEGDAKKFISILDQVGKEAEKGLLFVLKYALPIETLVTLIFPQAAPAAAGAVAALNLIQKAVLEIKAKASLLPAGMTPAQMLAEEVQLVEPAVLQLLASEKITVPVSVPKIIEAVVAILNTQPAVA